MSVGGDVWSQAVHTELFNAPSIIKCVHVSTPRPDGLLRLRATRIFVFPPPPSCVSSVFLHPQMTLSISPLNRHPAFFFLPQRIAQRTTLGGRGSFDCWLSKAIITAASAGYENDFLSVKPVSLPGWPWCRRRDGIDRGKQTRLPLSPPGSNRTKWITHSNGKISDGNTCPRCLEGSTLHENSLLSRI